MFPNQALDFFRETFNAQEPLRDDKRRLVVREAEYAMRAVKMAYRRHGAIFWRV
jgi:hypothetical protein